MGSATTLDAWCKGPCKHSANVNTAFTDIK